LFPGPINIRGSAKKHCYFIKVLHLNSVLFIMRPLKNTIQNELILYFTLKSDHVVI
jgi:hypothetical protein